eukprot:COSAG01_NODE_2568_length_7442_cov_23.918970_4_plen_61_part_00
MGSLIPAVGLKFINNTAVLYSVPYSGLAAGCYCGLLYSGCGPEVSWEIPAVAYSPVYFRQ